MSKQSRWWIAVTRILLQADADEVVELGAKVAIQGYVWAIILVDLVMHLQEAFRFNIGV